MKRSIFFLSTLLVCAPLFAIDVDPKIEKAVQQLLPVCEGAKVAYAAAPMKLPQGFRGLLVQVDGGRCRDQFVAVVSPTNGLFLGAPWTIADEEGDTIEQKLQTFTARNMQEAMTATVERKANEDGLWPTTLTQIEEAGKVPLHGFVDPQGRTFFFGAFRRLGSDLLAQRTKAFDEFLAASPAKGAAKPVVTIIEFSDFQCPSCKRASGYVDAILKNHADQVRYVRFDLPLSGHPWSFPAALAGRAIYRQNPDLFWDYKKSVYGNQESLNAFVIWDWARAWAEDHDLDLKKYDADLTNPEIREALLRGTGAAFSNDVRATPTYFVNGTIVEAGEEGKALATYVDKLLAK